MSAKRMGKKICASLLVLLMAVCLLPSLPARADGKTTVTNKLTIDTNAVYYNDNSYTENIDNIASEGWAYFFTATNGTAYGDLAAKTLVLDGANFAVAEAEALYITATDVTILLADGSVNNIATVATDASTHTYAMSLGQTTNTQSVTIKTVSGGSATLNLTAAANNTSVGLYINQYSTVTVGTGVTVNATGGTAGSDYSAGVWLANGQSSSPTTLNVTGGTLNANGGGTTGTARSVGILYYYEYTTVAISGGKITAGADASSAASNGFYAAKAYNNNNALAVTGGTVIATASGTTANTGAVANIAITKPSDYAMIVSTTDTAGTSPVNYNTISLFPALADQKYVKIAPSVAMTGVGITCSAGVLTAAATPAGAIASYQWYRSDTASYADYTAFAAGTNTLIDGATGASYTINTDADTGKYLYCTATAGAGTTGGPLVNTEGFLIAAPTITTAADIYLVRDKSYTAAAPYTLTATGTPTLTWSKVSGSLPSGLTLNSDGTLTGTCTAAYTYPVNFKAENTFGSGSKEITINVGIAPYITAQPSVTDKEKRETDTTTTYSFSVTAAGSGTLSYQWQVSADSGSTWADVTTGTGGSTSSYTTPATMADGTYIYHCAVSSSYGTVTSASSGAVKVLAVTDAPVYNSDQTIPGNALYADHYSYETPTKRAFYIIFGQPKFLLDNTTTGYTTATEIHAYNQPDGTSEVLLDPYDSSKSAVTVIEENNNLYLQFPSNAPGGEYYVTAKKSGEIESEPTCFVLIYRVDASNAYGNTFTDGKLYTGYADTAKVGGTVAGFSITDNWSFTLSEAAKTAGIKITAVKDSSNPTTDIANVAIAADGGSASGCVADGTSFIFVLSTADTTAAGIYDFTLACAGISDHGSGTITVGTAALTVTPSFTYPSVTPAISYFPEGAPAKMSVQVNADPSNRTMTYQWQLSTDNGATWNNVANGTGGTASAYTTPATAFSMNGYQYRCVVTMTMTSGQTKSATSTALTLAVKKTLTVTVTGASSPNPLVGDALTCAVTATGSPVLDTDYTLAWKVGGSSRSDTDASYTVQSNNTYDDVGYKVAVTTTPVNDDCTTYKYNADGTYTNYATVTQDYTHAVVSAVSVTSGNTTYPAVEVGSVLTANLTATGGSPTVSYKWQYLDGLNWTDIPSATAKTYTVSSTYIGKKLRVVVNGTNCYDGTNITSDNSDAVTCAVTAAALSSNMPHAGTAIAVTTTPADATVSCQWYTNTSSSATGGTAISGATNKSYTPAAADAGKYLYAVVTGTGYYTGSASAVTTNKVTIPITAVTLSTASPVSSSAVTAAVAPTGATATYQWQSSADGTAWSDITGATGTSYTPADGDAGKYLKVKATGSGNYSGSAENSTANKVTIAITNVSLSTDTPAAGTQVSATLTPTAASATYQWYTNTASSTSGGTAISGATNASYTPTADDADKYLYVTATGSGNYSGTVSKVTANKVTAAITGLTLPNAPAVGSALEPTITPSAASATYQWYTNDTSSTTGGTAVTGATNKSYTPAAADVGKYLYVTATGSGSYTGSASAVTTNMVTITITGVTLSSDNPGVGAKLTAAVAPSGSTCTYQWQISSDSGLTWSDITGATAADYTPAVGDFGKMLKVTVTGTGNYAGTASVQAANAVKLTDVITPTSTYEKGSAPTNEKYTIGDGIPAADLGAAHFVSLTIDGLTVTAGSDTFSVSDGSLIITFAQSYLNKLAVGTHTLAVTINGTYAGTYTTTITVTPPPQAPAVKKTPATGDSYNIVLWASLAVASLATAIFYALKLKKRRG